MKIKIKDLTFNCIIGILPQERKTKQQVIITLSFHYTFKKNKFIDYSIIASYLKSTMKEKKFLLIEDALLFFEKQLKSKYNIKKLKITIKKPNILDNCCVSVSN